MNPLILLPVIVGTAVVVQAGLNRQIAAQWGLGGAVLLNSAVVMALAMVLFLAVKVRPELFPGFLEVPGEPGRIEVWQAAMAGALGITIVAGLPWAFARLGALEVILTVMVAQVVASIVWDWRVEGIGVQPIRVIGAVVALGGAVLASWKR